MLIDIYAFQSIRFSVRTLNPSTAKIVFLIYWSLSVLCYTAILTAAFTDWHQWPKQIRTISFAMLVILFLPKILISAFLFLDDIIRMFRWAILKTAVAFSPVSSHTDTHQISRSDFIVKVALIAGAIPFLSLIWGTIYGAYRFTVRKVRIKVKDLPDEFVSFRIVQVSDIHSGSFNSKEPLQHAIKLINNQKPDVIFITGDLINVLASELEMHHDTLKSLSAKHGIYSILGNHDYGDYYHWTSERDKRKNFEELIQTQRDYGWKLLMDEHDYISINGKKIGVAGVQNWSARMGFQQYGNLDKAIAGMNGTFFNILLTHDPSHWRKQVLNHKNLNLTLSGHTHGMQIGVEIPGFKWSPSQYFYHEWAGLYTQGDQQLYVNRGLGFIGYPGRVGIMPEITLIELVKHTG